MIKSTLPFLLIIGIAAVLGVSIRHFVKAAPRYQPMTVRLRVYDKSQPTGEQVFSVSSNGDHRYQMITSNHVYGTLRLRGQGFYVIDDTRRWVKQDLKVNTTEPMSIPSVEQLRQSSNYEKDELIGGIAAVKKRQLNKLTGKLAVETWFAPDVTGFIPIKEITYDQDTGEVASRTELISIDYSEPNAELLKIPNYPRIQ